MSVTREQVEHVARLARLALDEAEVEALRGDLEQILDYVAKLSELDTESVAPLTHLHVAAAPLRPDLEQPGLSQAQALAEAPRQSHGGFAVPRFVEQA